MDKKKIIGLLCPVSFLAFGVYILLESQRFKSTDKIFPAMVAVLMIAISLIQLMVDLKKTEHKNAFAGNNVLRVAGYTAVLMLYAFLLKKIGYVLDTIWLTAFTLYALDYRKWKGLIIIPVAVTACLYVIFKVLLKVPLPMWRL